MLKQSDLTIVIPAYSEEKRIGATLDELAVFLKGDRYFKSKDTEVLVVAADTSDNTHKIIADKQNNFRKLHILTPGPRLGKGRDVQYGMGRATGKIAVYMDADLATPLRHLQQFYEACSAGEDLVIGTRDLRHYRQSKTRNAFASFGNLLYRLTSGIDVEDTQCGFKMFNDKARKLCFSKLTIMGWGLDIELLAIAKANNLMIKPIRIDDWLHKPYSTYTDGMVSITLRTMRDYWLITINRLKGTYRIT